MANTGEKQARPKEQQEQTQPEEQFVPEQVSFVIPNSLAADMPVPPPPGTPNSVMREMLDPRILSEERNHQPAVVSPGTPNSVMREMENHPGADPSAIQSHGNSQGIFRNEAGDSDTYSRDNSVRSCRGGASFSAAVHELGHATRRNSFSARVSRSVLSGTIQREGEDEKKEEPKPNAGSTSVKPVKTAEFSGLSVMVGGEWTDAKTAESMIKKANDEARRNAPTTTTTVVEEPDPAIQPDPGNGGEVLKDTKTGLWVEKNGSDLFVYIDGRWVAAIEKAVAPQPRPVADPNLSKNLLDADNSSIIDGEQSESKDNIIISEPKNDGKISGSKNSDRIIEQDLAEGQEHQEGTSAERPPDPNLIFGTGRRWRMSRTAITEEQINGMVKLYKNYVQVANLRRGKKIEFPTSAKITGPVQSALNAADDAVRKVPEGKEQLDDAGSVRSSSS
ncbi:MAG: hypothetical protein IJI14_01410, partial [Anaerolineaceae bacterium]|nr:hypothetical protein [Anaerolineaceae bacterium]